jgi:hypothetical protein
MQPKREKQKDQKIRKGETLGASSGGTRLHDDGSTPPPIFLIF